MQHVKFHQLLPEQINKGLLTAFLLWFPHHMQLKFTRLQHYLRLITFSCPRSNFSHVLTFLCTFLVFKGTYLLAYRNIPPLKALTELIVPLQEAQLCETELTDWHEALPHMVAAHWPVQLNQKKCILLHFLFLPIFTPTDLYPASKLWLYFHASDRKTAKEEAHVDVFLFSYWVKRLRKWHWSSVKGQCGFVCNSARLYCVHSSILPSLLTGQARLFCLSDQRQRCAVMKAATPEDVSDTVCLFLTLGRFFRTCFVKQSVWKNTVTKVVKLSSLSIAMNANEKLQQWILGLISILSRN